MIRHILDCLLIDLFFGVGVYLLLPLKLVTSWKDGQLDFYFGPKKYAPKPGAEEAVLDEVHAAGIEPLLQATDRSFSVPAGQIVRTGYVDVFQVRLACRERMGIGDVSGAFQKILQTGEASPFPCPNGYWDGDTFVLQDGRHEWVASVMVGKSHLLVAWTEKA